ncbi:DUF309 domain-containing protein [Schinkia sp. CFF1]
MYLKSYIEFLVHFHGSRDYFECHEILEEYWKQEDPKNRSSIWVGLIQIAVAMYHHRAGNFRGASRTLRKAIEVLELQQNKIAALGLDGKQLLNLLQHKLSEINNGVLYESMNLPIVEKTLLESCIHHCSYLGLTWNEKSDLSNQYLINKHSLRDRSTVIHEREKQLFIRKSERPKS